MRTGKTTPQDMVSQPFLPLSNNAHKPREDTSTSPTPLTRLTGYTTFITNTSSYPLNNPSTPKSWTMLPALRHAMTLYPHTPYLFHLAPTALIMHPQHSLEQHLLRPSRLESIMKPDHPVVPPDSVIRTFSGVRAQNVDLVLSQDSAGLAHTSLVLRTGEWARYLLDAWFDPLYRSYNFQKAERHALEHIVQYVSPLISLF